MRNSLIMSQEILTVIENIQFEFFTFIFHRTENTKQCDH